jgi:hypothetical protein
MYSSTLAIPKDLLMPKILSEFSGVLCPVEGAESGVDLARSALKMNASLEANLLNVT